MLQRKAPAGGTTGVPFATRQGADGRSSASTLESLHRSRSGDQLGTVTGCERHLQGQGPLRARSRLQTRQVELGGTGRQHGAAGRHQLGTAVLQLPDTSEPINQLQGPGVIERLRPRSIGETQAQTSGIGGIALLQQGERPDATALIPHGPLLGLQGQGEPWQQQQAGQQRSNQSPEPAAHRRGRAEAAPTTTQEPLSRKTHGRHSTNHWLHDTVVCRCRRKGLHLFIPVF